MQDSTHATNAGLDVEVWTIGFARRATAYKRADLLFTDPECLHKIATTAGGPDDEYWESAPKGGKALIRQGWPWL